MLILSAYVPEVEVVTFLAGTKPTAVPQSEPVQVYLNDVDLTLVEKPAFSEAVSLVDLRPVYLVLFP